MPDDPQQIEHRLVKFLNSRFQPEQPITVTTDLLGEGLLDSLLVVELVSWSGKQFQVTLQAADIAPRHFRSAQSLAKLIVERGSDDPSAGHRAIKPGLNN